MSRQIKPLPKILLALVAGTTLFFGVRYAHEHGYLSHGATAKSDVPTQVSLPELKESAPAGAIAKLPPPSLEAAKTGTDPAMKILIYAWNAHAGLLYANGGARTTNGSVMHKEGVDLFIGREDDNNKLQAALLVGAKNTKAGKPVTDGDGTPCITLMGDGTPAFLAGANPEFAKVSSDSTAVIVGTFGYSRGEDKLMGRAAWKANPKLARGALIAGVLRDGDWNIAMKWAGDNNLRNNPDETTWDADALNWLGVDSYIDAAEKYIAGTTSAEDGPLGVCVDRKVVKDGKLTGEKKNVCVTGVVTWTPGDVNVATKRGGLVSIVSTREYRSQMPCVLLCIKSWAEKNRKTVESTLRAAWAGADQVKAYPDALHKASEIAASVYKEAGTDAAYWEKYYKGVEESDKTGVMVSLGGSSVNNLNDNLAVFGLAAGSAKVFEATYTVFGNILTQQYPKLYPTFPAYADVVDTSYVANVAKTAPVSAPAEVAHFVAGKALASTVSKKSWAITFQTGSATFAPEAVKMLTQISNGALVADELAIEIHGHTDNTGDPAGNLDLSRRRAEAVKTWLMKQSSSNFPPERFSVVSHGQEKPVASNTSPQGQAMNRRVEIVLGTQ